MSYEQVVHTHSCTYSNYIETDLNFVIHITVAAIKGGVRVFLPFCEWNNCITKIKLKLCEHKQFQSGVQTEYSSKSDHSQNKQSKKDNERICSANV